MILQDVVKQCCIRTGDPLVNSLFKDEDNAKEWLGYISQAGQAIVKEHNWSVLKRFGSFTADGEKTEYDLPDDFGHLLSLSLYNTTKGQDILFINDSDFIKLDSSDDDFYTISGGKFVLSKPLTAGTVVKFVYGTNAICKNRNEYKPYFTDDFDEFLLTPELLILKAVALRAVNLGFEDAGARDNDYRTALTLEMNTDGGNVYYNKFGEDFEIKTTPRDWR